jgi:MinD superfamily P-loop ATPase
LKNKVLKSLKMKRDNLQIKLAVASGKGGVGKSMLASCLAVLFNKRYSVVAVDCDVDAPNLALWLNEIDAWHKVKEISTSEKPVFNYKRCNGCGICIKNCRFHALQSTSQGKPQLDQFLCEGCGTCQVLCPQKAIELKPVKNGQIREKKTKYGFNLISGQLYPGETGSGKIVSQLRNKVDKYNNDIMIIDVAPGTGCPVIAALRDTNHVVLVTEPTLSGISDTQRTLEVVKYFKLSYSLIINKWNINKKLSKKLKKWAGKNFLGKISYDQKVFKAIANLQPIMETELKTKEEIKDIFDKLIKRLAI